MDKQQVKEVLHRYQEGTCTELEKTQLESWYIRQEIPSVFELSESELDAELDKIWSIVDEEYKKSVSKFNPVWRKIAIAAGILFFITAGIYFYLQQTSLLEPNHPHLVKTNDDVKPGGNKAILIDAAGKQENLSDEIFVVSEHVSGSDRISTDGEKEVVSYNTILTPKGGQYQVVLSDGTRVWLNALSSLKYPISFIGGERRVELVGEGYFEVAYNPSKPFRVVSSTQVVEVLGTHFNINTYLDEPAVKTTLLEGSVRILSSTHNKDNLILKPGEQAIHTDNSIAKTEVDIAAATAWKNGFFQFENASLETVMRQISRWYDLEVEYKGKVSKRVFDGKVHRNMSLSNLLNVLSFSNVNYKVEGKKLIIMP